MNRTRILIPGMALLLVVGAYLALSLRPFFARPPLEFAETMGPIERQVISDWYVKSSALQSSPATAETFLFAFSHPLSPHQFRPLVSYGGLGGEGAIQVSYGSTVAIFRVRGGSLVLEHFVDSSQAEEVLEGDQRGSGE